MNKQLTTPKAHYKLLDGLRGVAALIVIGFHLFECYPNNHIFGHGYLAVEFFFILSGFVIGYAYDDRWQKKMTIKEFFRRRMIRLHPMVLLSVVFGAIAFVIQGGETWSGEPIALSLIILAMICSLFMIPALPHSGIEVRGNGEMFPLNGPMWSLFFEYIGNILYALFLRRLPSWALSIFTAISAAGVSFFAIKDNALTEGWAIGENGLGFLAGFFLMSFSFSIGLLLSRNFKPIRIKGAFWICSALLITLLAMPNFGDFWNGIFEIMCVILVFPTLVYLGASGKTTDKNSSHICDFLGKISYPLYIIHYPLMYLYYSWVWSNEIPLSQAVPAMCALVPTCIAIAYLCLKCYDEPIRRLLTRKFL